VRKNVIIIGLILLIACGALYAVYEVPQETVKSYNATVGFLSSGSGLPYNGQTYSMAYAFWVEAKDGDRIVITNELNSDNLENWATVFVERFDGTPIVTLDTFEPTFNSMIVGTSNLPDYGDGGYRIELGVVPFVDQKTPEGYINMTSLGSYNITVYVHSHGLIQTYLILSVLSLIAGIAVTIVGLVSRPKKNLLKTNQPPPSPQKS
jgi:hypothetical protein